MSWGSWFTFWRRGPRIVPVAEFPTAELADQAWERLNEAGIPAAVITDPSMLDGYPKTRIEVEEHYVDDAQRLIADLIV